MKILKIYGLPIAAISLLVWCLSFVSPVYGSTPTEVVTLTQSQYNTLLKNFESTIDNQLNTINELEQQLSIAKMSTNESQQALIEALSQLREQKQLLIEAQNSLRKQEKMLQMQRLSLEKAEIYLNQQKEIIKKTQQQNRNSKILNVVLGTALVYSLVK